MSSIGSRYLTRLDAGAPRTPDVAALATLLAAHTRAIPFENLTSFTGHAVDLDPDAVLDKLIDRRRGGYCFEHALLSRLALADLGFATAPLLGRVYMSKDPDAVPLRSHSVTVVVLDGRAYLYDPGFGGATPTAPLLIAEDAGTQETRYGSYRFVDATTTVPPRLAPDVRLMLQLHTDDGWINLYGLTTGPVVPADVAAFNRYVSTAPDSVFTTTLVGALVGPGGRVTLRDRTLRRHATGEITTLDTEADFEAALRVDLGLPDLDPALVSAAWDRVADRVDPRR